MAERLDALGPVAVQAVGVDVVALGWAAVDDDFAFEAPALAWCRISVEGVDEAVELLVDAPLDVGGAGRELLEHGLGDVGDLGDAIDDGFPFDAEAGGELRAQCGVIDRRNGALVHLERSSIEGEPAPVG